jgi:hypothetical protein
MQCSQQQQQQQRQPLSQQQQQWRGRAQTVRLRYTPKNAICAPGGGLGLGLGLLQRPAVARSWSHPGSCDRTVKNQRCVTEVQVATVRRSKQAWTKAPNAC